MPKLQLGLNFQFYCEIRATAPTYFTIWDNWNIKDNKSNGLLFVIVT